MGIVEQAWRCTVCPPLTATGRHEEDAQGILDHTGLLIRIRLSRVAELRQVGCGRPPTPPAPGVRDRLTAAELWTTDAVGPGLIHKPTSCQ